ncbi:potassium-transporting ATPase subunit KdpC [Magnetospirillum gryphiswaldense]|uniref:Potassium-transporting ATPase KdpC subunit n=1 Tax=Magnetospirillum gryphiswaldense TaxID=55518 RepID=A4U5M6_9PROT|nr:potassium-transporting ATPase subunit KdpC [Magnetospirillum gryphiswaldense]AVM73001.1 Potassium-transporting ATPase C chain [Magnetospirillum gryphiswaldense MSR-1]AVM76904.1 Potassium-transporting ATPase C chain [Magnetospirillum gryphiswaldense]CAM78183.1 Potassium-transporting ATPase C chain [Magnetospirillum gryphiswaldense MSR-1]
MIKELRPALSLLLMLTVLTGLAYPLAVTGLAQLVFPWQAQGSLIERDGHVVGSALIGQSFSGPGYFHGRPSATADQPYNAANSMGSNLAPSARALADGVTAAVQAAKADNPGNKGPVPMDLVTASASGLDPHISPAAARFQVKRVANARRVTEDEIEAVLATQTEGRELAILGEARVNVLMLNLALDQRWPIR